MFLLNINKIWKKHVALTQEHGSWVFLFSPLIIGLAAGKQWTSPSVYLILTATALFLFKQPLTIAVKIYSKRRPKKELPAAYFWMAVYSVIALFGFAGLVANGQGYLVVLALPGLSVLIWYLYLVSQRAERRQLGVDIVASGVLALSAPAAYWVGIGRTDPYGWWLWILAWFQSAASIVYAGLRLTQRSWEIKPDIQHRFLAAQRAIGYTTFNFLAVLVLGLSGILPSSLFLSYGVQWVESLWGTVYPAVGVRPTSIGMRQLMVSILFTILFIATWR